MVLWAASHRSRGLNMDKAILNAIWIVIRKIGAVIHQPGRNSSKQAKKAKERLPPVNKQSDTQCFHLEVMNASHKVKTWAASAACGRSDRLKAEDVISHAASATPWDTNAIKNKTKQQKKTVFALGSVVLYGASCVYSAAHSKCYISRSDTSCQGAPCGLEATVRQRL